MLTRDEILAMPASPELNALVAEKVMGFPNVHKFYHRYVYDNVGSMGNVYGRIDVIDYSTDISAAWEVVERFPLVQIEYVEIFEGNKSVNVNLWENGCDLTAEPIRTTAKTAPEAICKAALLAVMEGSQ